MRHNILLMLILSCLTGLCACSGGDRFKVEARIDGLGEEGLIMRYLNGGIQEIQAHAVDSKAKLQGISPDLTLVELFTADGEPLCSFTARNGDKITIQGSRDQLWDLQIKGNKSSEDAWAFINQHKDLISSRNSEQLNREIARFIKENPENGASGQLLATLYHVPGHEKEAYELGHLLKKDAALGILTSSNTPLTGIQKKTAEEQQRGAIMFYNARHNGKDTTFNFYPSAYGHSILAFTSARRGDSIVKALKKLPKKVRVIEVTLGDDSLSWRGLISGDSATWIQTWLPGGTGHVLVRRYQINTLPFFVALDSTGTQLYRGPSVTRATRAANL